MDYTGYTARDYFKCAFNTERRVSYGRKIKNQFLRGGPLAVGVSRVPENVRGNSTKRQYCRRTEPVPLNGRNLHAGRLRTMQKHKTIYHRLTVKTVKSVSVDWYDTRRRCAEINKYVDAWPRRRPRGGFFAERTHKFACRVAIG